ncbi:MAG: arsenate reductase ArsC [Bacteroidota bacterium]
MEILILCTGNSCRSQMAEGFLRSFDGKAEVYSAGTRPEKEVNPRTIMVMNEIGIDLSGNTPDHVEKYLNTSFDYVITVCDGAKDICPTFVGNVRHRLHIGFEDPAAAKGTDEEILAVYREIRDQIKEAFYRWFNTLNQ